MLYSSLTDVSELSLLHSQPSSDTPPHITLASPVLISAPNSIETSMHNGCVTVNVHVLSPLGQLFCSVTTGFPQQRAIAFLDVAYGVTVTGTHTVSF